jgi:hypothetical protein
VDWFTYYATDNELHTTNIATFTIKIGNWDIAVGDRAVVVPRGAQQAIIPETDLLQNLNGPIQPIEGSGPSNGQLVENPDGSFTYTPDPDFYGTDEFYFRAIDPVTGDPTEPLLVEIEVPDYTTHGNEDTYFISPGASATHGGLGLLWNDDWADTVLVLGQPENGTVTFSSNGSFEYWPDNGFAGTDSFYYVASDFATGHQSAPTLVTIDVTALPAQHDEYSMPQSAASLVIPAEEGVLANDPGTYTKIAELIEDDGPAYGTLSLADDGSFVYAPPVGFIGTDFFSYYVIDENSGNTSMPISVEIHVGPHASPDFYAINAGDSLNIWNTGVLFNDVGWETAHVVTEPGHDNGSFELHPDGKIDYTPITGFAGTDYFEYRVYDSATGEYSPPTTVTIDVVNPIAVADSYTIARGSGPLRVNRPGVLANDNDASVAEGLGFVPGYSNGAGMLLNPDGSFVLTPNPTFAGLIKYEYRVQNLLTLAYSPPAIITIEITAPPDAVDDNYSVEVNSFILVGDRGILQNDSRAAGFVLFSFPQHGTLSDYHAFDGEFRYTPSNGYIGPDSFQYRAWNQYGYSEVATVHIDVHMDPIAVPDTYQLAMGQTSSVSAPGVRANDTYADIAELVTPPNPNQGSVTLNSNGSFTFAPAADFTGTATFQYRVKNLLTGVWSAASTVTIFVAPHPQAVPDEYSAFNNQGCTYCHSGVIVDLPGVLENDSGANAIRVVAGAGPHHGTLHAWSEGSFVYRTNDRYFIGSDSFQYVAVNTTTGQESTPVTVTLHVLGPEATPDEYFTTPSTSLYDGVLANDHGHSGAVLVPESGPSHGYFSFYPDGTFYYLPESGFEGIDTFQYMATSYNGSEVVYSAPATVTIHVRNVPVAVSDIIGISIGDGLLDFSVIANDVWADSVQLIEGSGPTNGSFSFNSTDGTFSYQPSPGFEGVDWFQYVVTNSVGENEYESSPGWVMIYVFSREVQAVPDFYSAAIGIASIAQSSVLDNDGIAVKAVPHTAPENGTLDLRADGRFTYTPNAGFVGTDSFQYVAIELIGLSSYSVELRSDPVVVTVQVSNVAPLANDDIYWLFAGETLQVSAPGLLVNDSYADEIVLVEGPSSGTLSWNPDGSFTYVPTEGFLGTITFRYKARNSVTEQESADAVVTIHFEEPY